MNKSISLGHRPCFRMPVRLVCAVLMITLLTGGLALAEEDPVVVRVGEFSYTVSEVQKVLDTDLTLSRILKAEYLTPEEKQLQKEATIDRLVGICLLKKKLSEAHQDSFTSEEEERLKAAARVQYEDLWQQGFKYLQENELSTEAEDVTYLLDSMGISVEAAYEELKLSELRNRAIKLFCPDTLLTEKQVNEYYEEQFLAPDRERYKDDIKAYETEILATGSESFYTPEGYRFIRQILLEYPREVGTALRNDTLRVQEAADRLQDAFQALAMAAASATGWDEMVEPRKAYDAALAEANEAQSSYEAKRKELTEPLVRGQVEEIRSLYESGTSFQKLISRFSTDLSAANTGTGGYPFHPASDQWPENFIEAASALEKPGDISEPVYTDLGIHILYYEGDIPSGDYELTEEEKSMLEASALRYYQDIELEKLIEKWKNQYFVETHPELVVY